MRQLLAILALLGLVLVAAAGCKKPGTDASGKAPETSTIAAGGGGDGELVVYIPCGLTLPMKAALAKFREENPGMTVKDEFDSGVVLARRIVDKGERPDVLFTPGATEMAIVEAEGLIDEQDKQSFGAFELCLIVPKGNPAGIHSIEDIGKANPLSCPDPEFNSSGAAAEESLEQIGLWDVAHKRMLTTEIAHASHEDVAGGKAQAGVCFKACPLDTAPEKLSKSKVTIAADFPLGTYTQPKVMVAILNTTQHRGNAQKFVDFILREDVQQLLAEEKLPGLMGPLPSADEIKKDLQEYEAAHEEEPAPEDTSASDEAAADTSEGTE